MHAFSSPVRHTETDLDILVTCLKSQSEHVVRQELELRFIRLQSKRSHPSASMRFLEYNALP